MAERGAQICFVADEVIRRKIRNYLEKVNAEDVPMKKSRKSQSTVPSSDAEINEEKLSTREKENKTPRRSTRKNEKEEPTDEKPAKPETPKEPLSTKRRSSTRVLKEKKPVIHIQRLLASQNNNEDSDSNDDSPVESDSSDAESTDNEIQFKVPVEIIKDKTPTLVKDETQVKAVSSTTKNVESCETKLSKLKEMSEAYFAVHHHTKIVTSDRTLSRLQNPRMTQKELQDRLADTTGSHKKDCNRLFKEHLALFPKWIFQLRQGFNILLHGLGSKRRLLEEFRKQMLPDSVHIVVNGFFPSLTIKSILNMITEDLLNFSGAFKNIIDQCNYIKSEYNSEEIDELFLLIHNIDGPMLRNSKVQNAISYLASSSKIHILATIDHINAPIIWDQSRSSRFNWLWYDTTTFDRYTEETSFENSLLVQQTGSLALTSLTHVLRSLTPNARGIFKLLVEYQLENDSDSNYIGISFADLYKKCREKFLVNSDLTLRAQLTEFRDHKLIKFKKGADGVENLSIPLNSTALKQFMEDNEL